MSYDKETVECINDIQKMDMCTKSILFNLIDTYIQISKPQKHLLNLNNMNSLHLNINLSFQQLVEVVKQLSPSEKLKTK